jgi:hypothetical protein
MEDKKLEYISFVHENSKLIPVFYHPEWLNAVCGDSWMALVYKNGSGMIEAVMPLPFVKFLNKYIFKMPKQTQYLGIYFHCMDTLAIYKKYAKEQEIINYFIEQLPKFLLYKIRFSSDFINHQPFYWKGFKQTNQYSYCLDNIKNHENLFNSFKGSVRTDIRKAEKQLKIIETDNLETFYEINKLSFHRQKMEIKYSFDLVRKVDDYLKSIDQRR